LQQSERAVLLRRMEVSGASAAAQQRSSAAQGVIP